jgi:hypothetical protein
MVPAELGRFFWDVDPAGLDPVRHESYIIERILEFGDEKAARWLFSTFSRGNISAVLDLSRSLSMKSRNFWRLRLTGSLQEPERTVAFSGLAVASLEDIGCMKIEAIVGRGRKRDFIDLYFLLREMGFDLESLLGLYRNKYASSPANGVHVLKSLIYFIDADADPEPVMLVDYSWPEIKEKMTALVGQQKI